MSLERFDPPLFYLTKPTPCPYLPDRLERKAFTPLIGPRSKGLNDALAKAGFRRSQTISYRPLCDGCNACVSIRIPCSRFRWSKRFRRCLQKNTDLIRDVLPPIATDEMHDLFRRYLDARHADGGMADMDATDFANMIEETHVETHVVTYRLQHKAADGDEGQLVGAVLVDWLDDGLSLVYAFYDPDLVHRSLGTYMILDHIRALNGGPFPNLYLGYWVEGSKTMDYKRHFQPQEHLTQEGWREDKTRLEETKKF